MAANYYSVLLSVLLLGCGQNPQPQQQWTGGLVGVFESIGLANPVPVILHQGHDCWNGCRSVSLVPVVEKLTASGRRVYVFEMPPEPHNSLSADFYVKPVLDLIEALNTPVIMIGLSGGGWTTSVVTAIDSRVKGYSISGDMPLDMFGNYELDSEYHSIQDYRELYQRAGNRLLHIYNYYEGGIFSGISGDIGYAYINDYTAQSHMISPWAIDFILEDN